MGHWINNILRLPTLFALSLLFLIRPVLTEADCLVSCDRVSLIWSKDQRSIEPLFRVVSGKRIGYIDATGVLKIPYQFKFDNNEGGDFEDGLATVKVGRDWGYINAQGNVVISPQFDWAEPFSEDRALVRFQHDGPPYKIGYIDRTGKPVGTPNLNGAAQPFREGLAAVEVSRNNWGYLDLTGRMAIEPRFVWAQSFSQGLARVIEHGECEVIEDACDCRDFKTTAFDRKRVLPPCTFGYINKTGKIIFSGFQNALDFADGLAAIRSANGWGFVDQKGTTVIAEQFQRARSFSEGLAAVRQSEKWGFIDRSGRMVIPFQFDNVEDFSEGIAVVLADQQYRYIDRTGKQLFGRSFSLATPFVQGLAHVGLGDRQSNLGYINHEGAVVFEER